MNQNIFLQIILLLTVVLNCQYGQMASEPERMQKESLMLKGTMRPTESALSQMRKAAEKANMSAMSVWVGGVYKSEFSFEKEGNQLLPLMSVTKSVVALAMGAPAIARQLPELDTPLFSWQHDIFFGHTQPITMRHLLEQTSGLSLQTQDGQEIGLIYAAPNLLDLARRSRTITSPGSTWRYNNNAVNILSLVISRAAGEDMVSAIQKHLFMPLGITAYAWERDETGHPLVMAGLSLSSRDLGRLGMLVLQNGVWEGKRVVDESWMDRMLRPSSRAHGYGLMWWRGFYLAANEKPPSRSTDQQVFWAQGYGGQYLFVLPKVSTVLALQKQTEEGKSQEDIPFDELVKRIRRINLGGREQGFYEADAAPR